jgi:hypothetical protein
MVYNENQLEAVIPANLNHNTLYSHQGLTYGGIVVKSDLYLTSYISLVQAILLHVKSLGISKFVIKEIPHTYATAFNDDFRYLMNLVGAKIVRFDVLPHIEMSDPLPFQSRRERSIKKAAGLGLVAEESQDLAAYWELLTAALERYGAKPVHSIGEITGLKSKFPDNIRLFMVKENGDPIAGVLVFETKRVARAQYISSSERGRDTGALDLLFQHLIQKVFVDKKYFEFGTTTLEKGLKLNYGLSDQKEGFGARSVVHQDYEIDIENLDLTRLNTLKL